MKHFAHILLTYAIALAIAGLALTGFGLATGWLSELPGQRMALFVFAFLVVIGLLHWNGPPRWWLSCLAWMALSATFIVACLAVDEQATNWLLIYTLFGIVPAVVIASSVLGAVHWGLTSAIAAVCREPIAFRDVLKNNPLAVVWIVALVWVFVALVLEIMLGDPERLFDFLRALTRYLEPIPYAGEQTIFRLVLIGAMGLVGWSVAGRIDAPAPWAHVIGFSVGGAIVAQVWDVPIYQPAHFLSTLGEFAGLYRTIEGGVTGALCGALWAGVGMAQREMTAKPG